MNLLERLRRFWLTDTTPDHPLTEREREEMPPAATDENAGYIFEGFWGETLGPDRDEDPG